MKTRECTVCKDKHNLPNQQIGFEKVGEDPITGKVKWKILNANGSQHEHGSSSSILTTTGAAAQPSDMERMHNENVAAWNANTEALKAIAQELKRYNDREDRRSEPISLD